MWSNCKITLLPSLKKLKMNPPNAHTSMQYRYHVNRSGRAWHAISQSSAMEVICWLIMSGLIRLDLFTDWVVLISTVDYGRWAVDVTSKMQPCDWLFHYVDHSGGEALGRYEQPLKCCWYNFATTSVQINKEMTQTSLPPPWWNSIDFSCSLFKHNVRGCQWARK